MADKKLIVVFGATGAQGGSVARALLDDGTFAVKAVTRNIEKRASQELKKRGAELVKADMDNTDTLEPALTGAYGVFIVTNYWEHLDQEKEISQGKCLADLCKRLGLKHVVYSGLENVKKLTDGKLEVKHFDGKGVVEEYFRANDIPTTIVRISFYYDNFLTFFPPQKAPDGDGFVLALPIGDCAMDGFAIEDVGPAVVSVLKAPEQYIGRNIGISAEKLTTEQYAAIMSKTLGKTVKDAKGYSKDLSGAGLPFHSHPRFDPKASKDRRRRKYAQITPEAFEKLGFPGAEEMANMFRFVTMNPERNIELTFKLNPKVKKFAEWMELHKDSFKDL